MRPAQTGFDFDILEMSGFTHQPIEDFEARTRRQRAEREARERREREAREAREHAERQKREREEQARRERESRRSNARHHHESPWEVLGVRPGASQREIRAAWVRACKAHHPDAGGDLDMMKRVNAAYERLKGQGR